MLDAFFSDDFPPPRLNSLNFVAFLPRSFDSSTKSMFTLVFLSLPKGDFDFVASLPVLSWLFGLLPRLLLIARSGLTFVELRWYRFAESPFSFESSGLAYLCLSSNKSWITFSLFFVLSAVMPDLMISSPNMRRLSFSSAFLPVWNFFRSYIYFLLLVFFTLWLAVICCCSWLSI